MAGKQHKLKWDKWPSKKRDRLYKIYLRLRTYQGTSKEFGCSIRTVKRYVEEYGWRDALAEQDRQVQAKQNAKAVEERMDSLEVVEDTIEKLRRDYDIAEPGNKPSIAGMIDRLIGKRELLLGRPTDRPEVSVLDQIDQRYAEHMAEIAERKRKRAALRKKGKK